MNFRRIHLTGSLGFIGSNLSKSLSSFFACPIRFYDYRSNLREEQPDFLIDEINLGNCDDDVILHFGAVADTRVEAVEMLNERNIEYTFRLAEALRQKKIRIIFASSAAVYGNSLLKIPEDRDNLNNYALSKLTCETFLVDAYENRPSELCMLRLHNVYGPFELAKGSMMSIPSKFICDALRRGRIHVWQSDRVRNQARDFIHVEDVCELVIQLLMQTWSFPKLDVGTGYATPLEHLADEVSKITKCKWGFENFPSNLKEETYQLYTKANTSLMKQIAPKLNPRPLESQLSLLHLHYSGEVNR